MQTAASTCSRTSAERLATLVLAEMAMGWEAADDVPADVHQSMIECITSSFILNFNN
jgi:sirohydrochlorin ferrochelatase